MNGLADGANAAIFDSYLIGGRSCFITGAIIDYNRFPVGKSLNFRVLLNAVVQ
ncbi:hypothetical protein NDI39_08555 [Microcoleus sp. ZQ-A2]